MLKVYLACILFYLRKPSSMFVNLQKNWQQAMECLSLTLEEIVHIRSVLTKAELESLPVEGHVKEDVEKRKVRHFYFAYLYRVQQIFRIFSLCLIFLLSNVDICCYPLNAFGDATFFVLDFTHCLFLLFLKIIKPQKSPNFKTDLVIKTKGLPWEDPPLFCLSLSPPPPLH